MKSGILIIIAMTVFPFVVSHVFASPCPDCHHMQPQFDGSRAAPFSVGLFFGALAIIGICIFLIVRSRKSDPSRIKWFYLFISLSSLLVFSLFYATGAFDPLEEYMLGI